VTTVPSTVTTASTKGEIFHEFENLTFNLELVPGNRERLLPVSVCRAEHPNAYRTSAPAGKMQMTDTVGNVGFVLQKLEI